MLPYAKTLLAAGKAETAYDLLNDYSSDNPQSPQVYKLLAQAAGATGRQLQTHTAMSQHYFLNGFTNQAIEQLKLAEKTRDLSGYEAARIQSRIKQLELLLEAEKLE